MAEYHICELCNRNVSTITKHHLIPVEKGGNKFNTIHLCIACHTSLHALFTNRELAARFNSLELIKRDPKIIKYLGFIKNIPADDPVEIKKSRRVRKSG